MKSSVSLDLFEEISVYDYLNTKGVSQFALLIDGINDFNSFSNIILEYLDINSYIIKIHSATSFISMNSDMNYFRDHIEPLFKTSHYRAFSIFLKKSLLSNKIQEFFDLKQNIFYLYLENDTYQINDNFNNLKNLKDVKCTLSYPRKYLYGFDNFSDLISSYVEIIKNYRKFPVFAILPLNFYSEKEIDLSTCTGMASIKDKESYPIFSSLNFLHYFGFKEKVPPKPQRMMNVDEIYSISNVNDVQISHLYQRDEEESIRTFLGFDSKFRMLHAFDFFNRKEKMYDDPILLVKEDQMIGFNIKYDLYYIEIRSLFESSLFFSIDFTDSFQLNDSSSSFLRFENLIDFYDAKYTLKTLLSNRLIIKNLNSFDNEELTNLFPSQKTLMKRTFFVMFRIKVCKESQTGQIATQNNLSQESDKNQISIFLPYLKECVVYKEDLICSLDNKKYFVAGFKSEQARNNALYSLDHSKYLVKVKCFIPEGISKKIPPPPPKEEFKQTKPLFQPKENTFYIYFEEFPERKLNYSTNKLRPLFGLRNISDLQRNFIYDDQELTFIGFKSKEALQKAIDVSFTRKNELITNAVGGNIYSYPSDEFVIFEYKKCNFTDSSSNSKVVGRSVDAKSSNSKSSISNSNENDNFNNSENKSNISKGMNAKPDTNENKSIIVKINNYNDSETNNNNNGIISNKNVNTKDNLSKKDDKSNVQNKSNDESTIQNNSDNKNAITSNHNNNSTIPNSSDNKNTVQNNNDNKNTVTNKIDNKSTILNSRDNKNTVINNNDNKNTVQNNNDNKNTVQNSNDNNNAVTNKIDKKSTIPNNRDNKNTVQNIHNNKNTIPNNNDNKNFIQISRDNKNDKDKEAVYIDFNSKRDDEILDKDDDFYTKRIDNDIDVDSEIEDFNDYDEEIVKDNENSSKKGITSSQVIDFNKNIDNDQNPKEKETKKGNHNQTSLENFIINLKDYQKLEENPIGNGSYGAVYLVENVHTHKKYVAKMKTKCSISDQDFIDEISFYTRFKFPPILSLHGYSQLDYRNKQPPTMLLDFMPNGSLDKLFAKARKSNKYNDLFRQKKYIILLGIAIAMEYLHNEGVVHRDLKPDNILLDDNYYPRISDFGSSIMYSERDQKRKQTELDIVSSMYIAPEIFLEKEAYSYKVDVYSFAMIAYELLTGIEPFSERNYRSPKSFILDVIKGARPDLSVVSDPEIQAFFKRCWSEEPSERPSFQKIYETIVSPKFQSVYQCDDNEHEKLIYWCFQDSDDKEFNFQYIKEAASNGDPKAMYKYAYILYYLQDNQDEGIKEMIKAADKGYPKAIYYAGIFLEKRKSPQDLQKANNYFKKAADLGNTDAMVNYGDNLMSGIGTKVDSRKAVKYIKKAADLKNDKGLFNYGLYLLYGKGVLKNEKESVKYFKMAAELGNVRGMFQYACMLNFGMGIKRNVEESVKYYKKAIDYGYSDAMLNLGAMYQDGSLNNDEEQAEKYIKMAADLGNDLAMLSYGITLIQKVFNDDNDLYGVKKLLKKANKYLKEAANKGNASANYYLENLQLLFNDVSDDHDLEEKMIRLKKLSEIQNSMFQTESEKPKIHNLNPRNFKKTINKTIYDVEVNTYQTFDNDSSLPFIAISQITVSDKIRSKIDRQLQALPFFKEIKNNMCYNQVDINDIYSFYFFSKQKQKQKQVDQSKDIHQMSEKINKIITKIMSKEQIKSNMPDDFKPLELENYVYYDECLLTPDLAKTFIKILNAYHGVLEVKQNVFDGKRIVNYVIVKENLQEDVIVIAKELLAPQGIIFKTSDYPLSKDIIINEQMILPRNCDFDLILNEIKSIGIEVINVDRNKLFLHEYPDRVRKLFERFSFICFANEVDKMEAVNHLNSCVFKGKKDNVLHYKVELHYASFDDHIYPQFIREKIPLIMKDFKGMLDCQQNVVSIECPIEKTYIGFDTIEHLRKCHFYFDDRIKIWMARENPKFFTSKKGFFYLCIKSKIAEETECVANLISEFAGDIQLSCSEIKYINEKENDYVVLYISYVGYKTVDDLEKAVTTLEEIPTHIRERVSVTIYKGSKYAKLEMEEPDEAVFFYGNL